MRNSLSNVEHGSKSKSLHTAKKRPITNTMDGFIFVGTNFYGQNIFLHIKFIQKVAIVLVLKFVDWTFHENHIITYM